MAYRHLGAKPITDLRLVLVGQERVGKSSAGNLILGQKQFDCRFSSKPLTLSSEKREADVLGIRVSVVDTPGLFSSQLSEEEVKQQLLRAVDLSRPGPHVFLLTVQLGRFTEQEQKGLKTLETMLGPDVSKHTMILFTYGDRLEDTDADQFITGDENLMKLLNKCSGRYQVFNNRDTGNREQVKDLIDKIDSISEGGNLIYKIRSQCLSQRDKIIQAVVRGGVGAGVGAGAGAGVGAGVGSVFGSVGAAPGAVVGGVVGAVLGGVWRGLVGAIVAVKELAGQ